MCKELSLSTEVGRRHKRQTQPRTNASLCSVVVEHSIGKSLGLNEVWKKKAKGKRKLILFFSHFVLESGKYISGHCLGALRFSAIGDYMLYSP